jgi:hypothetical protein
MEALIGSSRLCPLGEDGSAAPCPEAQAQDAPAATEVLERMGYGRTSDPGGATTTIDQPK